MKKWIFIIIGAVLLVGALGYFVFPDKIPFIEKEEVDYGQERGLSFKVHHNGNCQGETELIVSIDGNETCVVSASCAVNQIRKCEFPANKNRRYEIKIEATATNCFGENENCYYVILNNGVFEWQSPELNLETHIYDSIIDFSE